MSGIEDQVIGKLFCYGKLGLLIEDAPDAELRAAREIYGADGLPRWWLHCDDMESGAEALGAVVRAVVDGDPSWASGLPVVMVVDRYLKKAPSSTQVVPWDDPDKGSPDMREVMNRLRPEKKPDFGSHVAVASVTSYFNPQGTGWQARHHEPLFQLRREMNPSLLAFGPADWMPLADRLSPPAFMTDREEVEEAVCRSRLWDDALEGLVPTFRLDSACIRILFTGAGASFANHPLAPGIPPTWFLLDWASWRVCTRDGTTTREEPSWPPNPTEEAAGRAGKAVQSEIHTARELLGHFAAGHSAHDVQWSLERLFDDRRGNHARLADLVNAFRQALQRYDHDFPYHTWLLAHLPWNIIATTNFDGFHERAAASVASTQPNPDAAERARRFGDVLELKSNTRGRRNTPSDESIARAGLFKPYGSLMRSGLLALTEEHFWDRIKPFERVLDRILARSREEVWLVIVGQRLASEALTAMLETWLRKHRNRTIHIVWVDPSCCRLGSHTNANAYFLDHFRKVVEGENPASGKHRFYPLPARALDFAYDLWGHWWRQQR